MVNALVNDGLIETPSHSHPNFIKFVEVWKDYIVLKTEDTEKYELLKKQFINCFTEKWFFEWLVYSYYFVRTETMRQRNLQDNNLRDAGS